MRRPVFLRLLLPVVAVWAAPDLPVDLAGGVIFLRGTVNGRGPVTFILDTGATETMLTPPTADRLGLTCSTGTAFGRRATATIAVGDAVARDLPVMVLDPPQALPLRLDHGLDYHGLLGYTFLSRFVVTVDYCRQRARLAPGQKQQPEVGQQRRAGPDIWHIPLEVRERLLHVVTWVNGRGPFWFLVDTGAAEIVVRPHLARALRLETQVHPQDPHVGFTTLASLAVGGASITNLPAIVRRLPYETVTSGYDGIVGTPFLSNFVVTIDYGNRVLTLANPR